VAQVVEPKWPETRCVPGLLVALRQSVFRWPYPTEAVMKNATTGVERRVSLPSGSVFAEVLWDEAAWPLVKSGKVRGYSMGGRALRVRVAREAATVEKRAPLQSAFHALVHGRTNRLNLR
jgi:hypothetical protein